MHDCIYIFYNLDGNTDVTRRDAINNCYNQCPICEDSDAPPPHIHQEIDVKVPEYLNMPDFLTYTWNLEWCESCSDVCAIWQGFDEIQFKQCIDKECLGCNMIEKPMLEEAHKVETAKMIEHLAQGKEQLHAEQTHKNYRHHKTNLEALNGEGKSIKGYQQLDQCTICFGSCASLDLENPDDFFSCVSSECPDCYKMLNNVI